MRRAKDYIGLDKFDDDSGISQSIPFSALEGSEVILTRWEVFTITKDDEEVIGVKMLILREEGGEKFSTLTYSQVVREQLETITPDNLPFIIEPMKGGSGIQQYWTIA